MQVPYQFKHGDRPLEGITVQRAVGRGGFGEVYYALADSGKEVALKHLRENPETELRGISEVMNLKSPHLITIYDVRRNAGGECFVIMEYVSGPSLRDVLRAEPAGLSPERAAAFVQGMAQGLSQLHERGIVHRDLKPANVFYDQGYVKIGDYGLSKHLSGSQHSGQTISVGTVHYMAPEIGSGSYTKLVDIYALGVILYEMLTGRLPFTGESLTEVLMRQLNEQPDTSMLPPRFAPVVARTLAKQPQERYQNVLELSDAVAKLVDGEARPGVLDSLTRLHAPAPATDESPPPRAVARESSTFSTLDARRSAAEGPQRPSDEVSPPYAVPERPQGYRMPDEWSFDAWLYASIVLHVLLLVVELAFGDIRRGHASGVVAHMVVLIPMLLAVCVLEYRWWASLPRGWRRTTPAKAVGFGFIPFFNVYWMFVALYGLAVDVKRYLDRHGAGQTPAGDTYDRLVRVGLAFAVALTVRSVAIFFGLPTPWFSVVCAGLGIPFTVLATRACQAVVRTRRRLEM
jgi:serine/threonine protein kinase